MKIEMIKALIISICILLVPFFLCGCVDENTNKNKLESAVVAINSEGDFTSIQDAIDNVQNGGKIYVKNGIYSETININKTVSLVGENKNFTIINCNTSSTIRSDSIFFIDADNCSIQGFNITCKYYSSGISGIFINSSYNLIKNNIINNYHYGINIHSSSNNNNILKNIVLNSRNGIEISGSENNNISETSVSYSSVYGIYLYGSDKNNISSNNLQNNYLATRLTSSNDNTLTENLFTNNTAGLKLCCSSKRNVIFKNIFSINQDYSAIDDVSNQWDNGVIGNYWDDYLNKYPDANSSEGIWDQPYNVKDDVYDRFPLVNPPII